MHKNYTFQKLHRKSEQWNWWLNWNLIVTKLHNYKISNLIEYNTPKIRNFVFLDGLGLLLPLCLGIFWFSFPLSHLSYSKQWVKQLVENRFLYFELFEFPFAFGFIRTVKTIKFDTRRTADTSVPSVPNPFFGRIKEKTKTTLCPFPP